MKNNEIARYFRIPIVFAILHTLIIGLILMYASLCTINDSSVIFSLSTLFMYLVDFPLAIVVESLKSNFSEPNAKFTMFALVYGVGGIFYWFSIGYILKLIIDKIKRKNL